MGELRLELSSGVECHAVCFTPGLDPTLLEPDREG